MKQADQTDTPLGVPRFTMVSLESIKGYFKTLALPWVRHNISKDSGITKKTLEAKEFGDMCGVKINRQTFSQYINGERFNLEFAILFSQVSEIPLSRMLGPTVYDNEKRLILKQANLKPLSHIQTNKAIAALPKDYASSDFIKVMRLPNDAGNFKKDDLALVDVEANVFIGDGLYLLKHDDTLTVKQLTHEPDERIIGKVTNVMVKA